jgi:hypothetical protein
MCISEREGLGLVPMAILVATRRSEFQHYQHSKWLNTGSFSFEPGCFRMRDMRGASVLR